MDLTVPTAARDRRSHRSCRTTESWRTLPVSCSKHFGADRLRARGWAPQPSGPRIGWASAGWPRRSPSSISSPWSKTPPAGRHATVRAAAGGRHRGGACVPLCERCFRHDSTPYSSPPARRRAGQPRRVRSRRRALDDHELAELIAAARTTSNDPELDLLVIRFTSSPPLRRSVWRPDRLPRSCLPDRVST